MNSRTRDVELFNEIKNDLLRKILDNFISPEFAIKNCFYFRIVDEAVTSSKWKQAV